MENLINEVLEAEFWSHYYPMAEAMMKGDTTEALNHVACMHEALEEVNELREESPCTEAVA